MKIKNGKIKEATEAELFAYYLKREFDDIMPFSEFVEDMKACGVIVTEKEN